MKKSPEVYKLNTYELPRRAGEMKEYELDIEIPERVGVELIAVPAGDVIEVDARLESVTEGVLLSAQIFATAKGECGRCLDPVEIIIERRIQELYLYEKKLERKKYLATEDELDIEDELVMEGDFIDLESPIRDLIVLALPSTPLCGDDCEGLCQECGGKWSELPATHAHEQLDARWAGLAALTLDEPDFKN
ncbi:MAG: YceD family protein [Candidatus Planktophila sp.]|nr:YceD family protein [Candidatus Planktophila sp.]